MATYYDVAEVKRAARGGWAGILSRFGVDAGLLTNRHSACPGCGGKDRFRFDDKEGEGTWVCSGGGDFKSGDGIALLMHVKSWEWKEAVQALGKELGLHGEERKGMRDDGVARRPEAEKVKMNELFDIEALRDFTAGMEEVTPEWLMERSPVDPRRVVPGEFLDTIYQPGERGLVFTNFYSQGDFAWEVGKGGFRLGAEKGVKAVRSALPLDGGKDGVWFLSNPVSLAWVPNPRKEGEMSRRTKECVTAWRYLVLECDESKTWKKRAAAMEAAAVAAARGEDVTMKWFTGPGGLSAFWAQEAMGHIGCWRERAMVLRNEAREIPGMWLKFLAGFPDPIRAIYSSGGESWHALVEVGRETWAAMDGLLKGNPNGRTKEQRMGCKALWARYGADPAALTPVRLTRLPGCMRGGKEQRLVYLNPGRRAMFEDGGKLKGKRILELVPRRKI